MRTPGFGPGVFLVYSVVGWDVLTTRYPSRKEPQLPDDRRRKDLLRSVNDIHPKSALHCPPITFRIGAYRFGKRLKKRAHDLHESIFRFEGYLGAFALATLIISLGFWAVALLGFIKSVKGPISWIAFSCAATSGIIGFTLFLLKQDPLGFAHGTVIKLRPAHKSDAEALSKIADAYFGSEFFANQDDPTGTIGRTKYFESLLDESVTTRVMWVATEIDECGSESAVAYTAILPLNENAYHQHLGGKGEASLSHYNFHPERHFTRLNEFNSRIPLYVFAVAIHPKRFSRPQARASVKRMFAYHIGSILESLNAAALDPSGDDFVKLYGEEYTPGGERFMRSLGGGRDGTKNALGDHNILRTDLPIDNLSSYALRTRIDSARREFQLRGTHGPILLLY